MIVLPFILTILRYLIPFTLLHFIVSIVTGQQYNSIGSRTTTNLLHGDIVRSCLALGRDEMTHITELDVQFLEDHFKKVGAKE